MTILRLFIIIALIGTGIHFWRERHEQMELRALTSINGFLPVPMPLGASHNTVLIFAPLNCPREGSQRANTLVQKLTDAGISVLKTDHYGSQAFEPNPEIEAGFKRLNTVMTGELPIVLINGMGKANPSIEEVVSEFRRTQQ